MYSQPCAVAHVLHSWTRQADGATAQVVAGSLARAPQGSVSHRRPVEVQSRIATWYKVVLYDVRVYTPARSGLSMQGCHSFSRKGYDSWHDDSTPGLVSAITRSV